jgi:hypothetical protein
VSGIITTAVVMGVLSLAKVKGVGRCRW